MQNDELYCLLVPLHEERLLLPRGCVSEVINYGCRPDGARAALVLRHDRGAAAVPSFSVRSRPRRTPPRAADAPHGRHAGDHGRVAAGHFAT
jgi:hypothetical protein